ncbi:MAG: glycosyltransferase family 2 protein [Candidatus Omnitrophica bacterium]|nr:glycosyltransferase family 2 protein [Candidatus Omnitrophota bacterium]
MKLSILMPTYNEIHTIEDIVHRVMRQDIDGISDKELVVVDDGSTDGTRDKIQDLAQQYEGRIQYHFHQNNAGKGAALRTAVEHMTGDLCIIQDADLEYDPADYSLVLEPIIQGRADCVYGSRFQGGQSKRVLFFWHYMGNKFLTLMSNMFTNLNLTDMETCYKAFRCDILKTIPIRCNRFGFEPEITAKISHRNCRIYEVGISYNGRTYRDGKKITWVDGFKAIFTILRFWFIKDSSK